MMKNKNICTALCLFSLMSASPLTLAQEAKWNNTVLGFTPPPDPVLGEMLGIRKILNDNGFTYNLGYLHEISWNGGGGYNHDSHVAYID